jgi:hypothetical protein
LLRFVRNDVDEIGLGHPHLAIERERLQPRQQFLEQDAHLELGEILAEAEMGTVAEGDVAVRLAIAREAIGLLEHLLVAVAGGVAQHQPVALRDPAAAELGVGGRRAHEVLHRGHPADCLVDQSRDQLGVGFHPCEFGRIIGERPDRTRGRG